MDQDKSFGCHNWHGAAMMTNIGDLGASCECWLSLFLVYEKASAKMHLRGCKKWIRKTKRCCPVLFYISHTQRWLLETIVQISIEFAEVICWPTNLD